MHPLSRVFGGIFNAVKWPSINGGLNTSFPRNAGDLGIKPVTFNGVDACPASANCIRVLSDSATMLPAYAVKTGDFPVKAESPDGRPHWLTALMERPHPFINRTKWRRWFGDRVFGDGQGFAVILRTPAGVPVALIPALLESTNAGLNPIRMDSEVMLQIPDDYAVGAIAGRQLYKMRDVLHVTNGSYDPFTGLAISPLESDAYNPIGRFLFLTKQFDDMMSKGGYQNVVMQLDLREYIKWKPTWDKEGGMPRIGPYQSAPMNAKFTQIGRSPVEQSFLDMLNAQVVDICRAFNVPVFMIQLQSKAGQTEKGRPIVEEQFRNFVRSGFGTSMQGFEDEFTLKLAPRGVRVKFDTRELTMGTMLERATVVNMLVMDAGVLTPNEGRLIMGLPPKPDGDDLRQPRGAPTQTTGDGPSDEIANAMASYTGEDVQRYKGKEGYTRMIDDVQIDPNRVV